ncbi:hypothetical protein LJC52_03830 [Bacteroidales bacterium OttesenSCG-928-A17]|nr:hypothetical protein [Bacteroidales bacterium OttesenSCG-928-A17]
MRYLAVTISLFLCTFLFAQDYTVVSINGNVVAKTENGWTPLSPRDRLYGETSIRIEEGAFLSVINKKEKKLFALKSQKEDQLIKIIKSQNRSATRKFIDHFITQLSRGNTERISHSANVTYKDLALDRQIYAALVDSGYKSNYPVSLELIDPETGNAINENGSLGSKFYFRISNHSDQLLFFNVLDITSENEYYDCFPTDEGGTMLHLLLPAESTIDFETYPMEFSEPTGKDRLTLITSDKPFDLRNIIRFLENNEPTPTSSASVGFYSITINIQ